jgi:hypothetical protein
MLRGGCITSSSSVSGTIVRSCRGFRFLADLDGLAAIGSLSSSEAACFRALLVGFFVDRNFEGVPITAMLSVSSPSSITGLAARLLTLDLGADGLRAETAGVLVTFPRFEELAASTASSS